MNNDLETKIKVAILDDHISAIDSYTLRLSSRNDIKVIATANYGNELPELLEKNEIDVMVLDVSVPNSEEDRSPYPLLYLLPKLRKEYPDMAILVISMHDQHSLVKAVLDGGASGYILKNDRDAISQLAEAVALVSTGGVYLSKRLRSILTEAALKEDPGLLSQREREVLSLAAAYPDISTEELAKRLDIAPSTVRNLLSKAYKRLKVRNRSAATDKARKLGLITPQPEEPGLSP